MKKTIIHTFAFASIITNFTFSSHLTLWENCNQDVSNSTITDDLVTKIYQSANIVETSEEPTDEQIVFTISTANEIASNLDSFFKNEKNIAVTKALFTENLIHPSLLRNSFLALQKFNLRQKQDLKIEKEFLLRQRASTKLQQAAAQNRKEWQKNCWKQEDLRRERKEAAIVAEHLRLLEPRFQQTRLFKAEERSRKSIEKHEQQIANVAHLISTLLAEKII